MRRFALIAFAAVVVLAACDNGTFRPGAQHGALRLVDDCADLEAVLKAAAIEQMRNQVMENMEWALESGACFMWDRDSAFFGGGGSMPPNTADSSAKQGAQEYSTTNTQEQGVDEADFVKNDGNTVYLLAGHEFLIFDAWPPPATHLLSSTTLEGKPRSLYIRGSKAVIYSDLIGENDNQRDCYYGAWGGRTDCAAQLRQLKITVLDIGDKTHPALEREIFLNGAYVSSRRIDAAVHTVATFPEIHFYGVRDWPDSWWSCEERSDQEIILAFMQLAEDNERIIRDYDLNDFLPTIRDTRIAADGTQVTDTSLLQDCRNFYDPVLPAGHSFLTLLSLSLDNAARLNLASIVGRQGEVYASADALYVATSYWNVPARLWQLGDQTGGEEATVIHKFRLDNRSGGAEYAASGVVRGRVLNQFSMGEHNGHLRLATTSGWVRNPETHNAVFVLEQQGPTLETIGSVTGLAPTEDIRSARFVGERGFVVTFKKTDPLFTIDLSDPRQPVLAGELKIPGFSTYIHMMDEDHLLTIGFDADDQGSFAWFQGIQLQIFDVSDMSRPERIQLTTLGTRGTTSEATANHLAFNYFPPKDVLALPMAICEDGSGGGSYGHTMSFSGLIVWDVTTKDGFSERGRVEHLPPAGEDSKDSCTNWWTRPNSRVKRSIIMDDFVFSISDNLMKINHLDDLATDLQAIELPAIPSEDPYWGW